MGSLDEAWVVQTPYLADLDPLDETPRHLLLTLPDPNGKDPSALCLRGLTEWLSHWSTVILDIAPDHAISITCTGCYKSPLCLQLGHLS